METFVFICKKPGLRLRIITKNTLLRFSLSYSDSDHNCKYNIDRALTLGSMSTFVAKIKKVKRVI